MSDNLIIQDIINNEPEINIPQEYQNTPYPFRPVKCVEEDIKNLNPVNNFLYFTTDTKKIYFGQNDEFLPMCSSTGFFYGLKTIEYDNSGFEPDPNVTFFTGEIEGESIPEIDDLILNIDGCFYRVKEVNEYEIKTVRLTLQGSGGGGSSSGGVVGTANFTLTFLNNTRVFASTATKMPIDFKGNYNGAENNVISRVTLTLHGETEPFYVSSSEELEFNVFHEIDLVPYKNLFSTSSTAVVIKVFDLYGTERSTTFKVQMVDIELIATQPKLLYSTELNYKYVCKASGTSSNISSKEIQYSIYDKDDLIDPIVVSKKEIDPFLENIQTDLNLSTLPGHGAYVLKVQAFITLKSGVRIPSNILTHKIAYYDVAQDTPILMMYLPEVAEQYTNISMDYLLVYPGNSNKYDLAISVDGEVIKTLSTYANTTGSYLLYFEESKVYTLSCKVPALDANCSETLIVNKYTGNLPIMNTSDLMLYLNPKGKSNNEITRGEWQDQTGEYTATLSNLHYGNADGWLTDNDGTSYLKLVSGASLSLTNFKPFQYDPTKYTDMDRRMGYGMTIEVDFEIQGTLDYDTELIRCVSTNQDNVVQVGFAITGDRIRFFNSRLSGGSKGPLMSVNLVEGKRTRVSFVIEPNTGLIEYPMAYTYLNGILSSAVIYEASDDFKDASFNPATLQINSTDGQIKIYGIRFYSSALSAKTIVNNYIASLPTLAEREKVFYDNNVMDATGKVNYSMVASTDYDFQIPYMTITGGWQTVSKDDKWTLKNQTAAAGSDNNPGLPTGKNDYRLIDIEVKYPKNSYFANYKDYKFKNSFASGNTLSTAFGEKPSNGGCIMYAQGTSSLEYPVKNLRIRFKKEEDWYTVRPDIAKVEIICMKADYMESSGSHNTGAANFIDALYAANNIKTPGQEHFNSPDNTIVTCIKGHPCLIFYRPDESSSYEYVGKYNLNLDKATPEPFGFNHDDSNFGYLDVGEKYWDIGYDDEGEYTGPEVEKTVETGDKINSIHCFEFLDNTIEVCNFANKAKAYIKDTETGQLKPDPNGEYYTYEETWYNTFINAKGKAVPGWTLGFESRYPEDKVGYHDADSLWPLASWLNELYCLRYGLHHHKGQANEAEALRRFKEEYELYLDKDFTLTYYLVTEALLMADNRVKNMMIATWGKEKRTLNGVEYNNYIFYPIFYDMDTMLGLDNTGVYRFNYYDEDTDSSIYNGDEVLWNFVRDALSEELAPYYIRLENSNLKSQEILPYFNLNQANMANAAFYNGDADYKYLQPAREGYHDDLNNKDIAPGVGPYLYSAQGDRGLMREWMLTNRMKFLRGKYKSEDYQGGDRIEFRWYFPTETDANPLLADSAKEVKPDGVFNLTSLKTGYAGVSLGKNAGEIHNCRFNGEESAEIVVTNADKANGTEAYILGLSNLTDLGDLSNKYMQKFIIASDDVRLKRLVLGNPHRKYYNPYWSTTAEGQSPKLAVDNCRYLQFFNLQNCSAYKGAINFSNCSAIETILLTGSGTSGITLPPNGMLKELRLPTTITKLSIDTHASLTADNFSLGEYVYGPSDKIGGDDVGHYTNDFSKLSSLEIIDTDIDSYSMVKTARNLEEYNLQGINWWIEDDCQYCVIKNDDPGLNFDTTQYYEYSAETKTYIPYDGNQYPSSGRLYVKYDLVGEDGRITHIPILEQLKTKRKIESTKYSSALSGMITISAVGSADEFEIFERYNKDFPNIIIDYDETKVNLSKAYRINFYNQTTITDDSVPYYSVLNNGTMTWSQLTSAEGPAGFALTDPIKPSTKEYNYVFTKVWYDADNRPYDATQWGNSRPPQEDLDLTPQFNGIPRLYTVAFYDDNRTLLHEGSLPYNTLVEEGMYDLGVNQMIASSGLLRFNYKPYDGTNPHGRYALKGWISENDFNNNTPNPQFYDLDNLKVTKDLKCYAYYVEEDARDTPTNPECFETVVYNGKVYAKIRARYQPYLQGKITFPEEVNNQTVVGVYQSNDNAMSAAASNLPLPMEIYFENGGKNYCDIGQNAFSRFTGLTKIYLPTTITSISTNSFYEDTSLDEVNFEDLKALVSIGAQAFRKTKLSKVTKLSDSIEAIGSSAFYSSNIALTALPRNLTTLETWAFSGCPKLAITEIDTTSEEGLRLNTGLFSYSAHTGSLSNKSSIIFTVGKNITGFEQISGQLISTQAVFYNYGGGEKVILKLSLPISSYTNDKSTYYAPSKYDSNIKTYYIRSFSNNKWLYSQISEVIENEEQYNTWISNIDEDVLYIKVQGLMKEALGVTDIIGGKDEE